MEFQHNSSKFQQQSLFPDKAYETSYFNLNHTDVYIRKLHSVSECSNFFSEIFQSNDQILKSILSASIVLLKPNITSEEYAANGRTTSPKVLQALIDVLLEIGVLNSQIIVADSSVIGINTKKAAEKAGILSVCKKNEIMFLDLNSGPFNDINVHNPLQHSLIPIHNIAVERDIYKINLAKIKTTYGSQVGFCVKNLKGLIPSNTKLEFHLRGVQESLVDLRKVLTCDLNVLEGFPGSELGIPKECNLIGISTNDIILDSIVSEIVDIHYTAVPHLKLLVDDFFNGNLNLSDNDAIKVLKSSIAEFKYSVHGISELAEHFGIDIIDGKPCTACLESFYKALVKLSKDDSLPNNHPYILGLWHVNTLWEMQEKNTNIFIGECALGKYPVNTTLFNLQNPKIPAVNLNKIDIAIPGCPPTIDSMVSKLKKIALRPSEEDIISDTGPVSDHHISLAPLCKPSNLLKKWIEVSHIDNALFSSKIKEVICVMPKEKVEFSDLNLATAIQCEFITAAICHQLNWDFIRERIKQEALRDPKRWDFGVIKYIQKRDFDRLLTGYPKKDRFRSVERAKMLRELSKIEYNYADNLYEILKKLSSRLEGKNGFLDFLKNIPVFSDDPEMKKAQVLIHSLVRSKYWHFEDEENIRPAIDYHIMRLYIRRGNIWPKTLEGENYLKKNIRRYAKTTSALRTIVASAMKIISGYHGLSIVDVNSAEWWIGRSVCKRNSPDCYLKLEESKWLRDSFNECPYRRTCMAWTTDQSLFTATEPREDSKFY